MKDLLEHLKARTIVYPTILGGNLRFTNLQLNVIHQIHPLNEPTCPLVAPYLTKPRRLEELQKIGFERKGHVWKYYILRLL